MSYKKISEYNAELLYREMLDNCFPTYQIGGLTFLPSQILEECDPIAYHSGLNDWLDAEELEIGEEEETEEEDD